LVLLAVGADKADAVARAVEGPLSSFVPASAIQLHPRATVVVDEAAAAGLELANYFRTTYASKPSWQSLWWRAARSPHRPPDVVLTARAGPEARRARAPTI
jgi:hypothetical protein